MIKIACSLLLCTTFLLVFAGCWQVVHVTDPEGNPLEGVHITTTYQDGYIGPAGPSGKTNSRGNAYLPVASQPYPMWMSFHKMGYFRATDGYTTNLKVNKVIKPIAGMN